ncbi:hypothetical protein [Lacinutrix mariniflava]|uniref:hypothetical protein n=1 Tax=Lacinutrix mariniflava TaxID=342955 RepID=UPI0006E25E28|nr:hypothetical protein [Lacinutrix mariniflava]
MRLIIVFDEDFKFYDTDIIISDSKPIGIKESQFIKVEVDGFKDYATKLDVYREDYAKSTKASILKDVVTSSINNFYRNCTMPVFAWVETMHRTLGSNTFSEIVIVGFSKNIGYMPYYEAEGEINKRLLYKSYDAVPAILSSILNKKRINHTLVNKKNVYNLRARIYIRRYVLLMFKLVLFLGKSIKSNITTTVHVDQSKYSSMMFSRGIAHTEFIEKLIKTYNNKILVHVADGLVSKNKNANYVRSVGITNSLFYEQQIKVTTVLKAFFTIVKCILSLPKTHNIKIEGVTFNFASAQREMLISYFDALIYKNTIKNYITPNIKMLVTCEMYTPFAYVISQIAKEKGIKSAQLQSTAMSLRKEPSYFYADFFLMNTKKSAETFKQIFPNHAKKIEFIGNITVDENTNQEFNKNTNVKKVVYFSQPIISELKEEDLLLRKLVLLEKELGFKLFIKLHPRENRNKFESIENLKYIEDGLTFGQYINNTDLAIFRTTSLGQQLLINNVPTITCLLTENSRQFNVDYIDRNYFGTVQDIDDIENRIENYSFLLKDFARFRKEYLKANNLDKGLFYFHNKLNQL